MVFANPRMSRSAKIGSFRGDESIQRFTWYTELRSGRVGLPFFCDAHLLPGVVGTEVRIEHYGRLSMVPNNVLQFVSQNEPKVVHSIETKSHGNHGLPLVQPKASAIDLGAG